MISFMISLVPPKTDWTQLSAPCVADQVLATVAVPSVQPHVPVGDAVGSSVSYDLITEVSLVVNIKPGTIFIRPVKNRMPRR